MKDQLSLLGPDLVEHVGTALPLVHRVKNEKGLPDTLITWFTWACSCGATSREGNWWSGPAGALQMHWHHAHNCRPWRVCPWAGQYGAAS